MLDLDEIRKIFREELAAAFKEVRVARRVKVALSSGSKSIFHIYTGSVVRKTNKIWDSVDCLSDDPLESILEAAENLPKEEPK